MMIKRLAALLLAAVILAGLPACGAKESSSQPEESSSEDTSEYPAVIGEVTIPQQPQTVVSLSPAITEWVADLDCDGQLAGVSDWCDTPSGLVDQLERCGTALQLDQSQVDSLGADLVLTSTPLTKEDQEYLELMEIPVLVLPPASTMEELKERYVDLARALGGETSGRARGEETAARLEEEMAAVTDRVSQAVSQREGGLSVILLREADYTMATGDTFEQTILDGMGLTNLAADFTDWQYPADQGAPNPQLIIAHETITIPMLEQNAVYKSGQATIYDQVVNLDFTALERQSLRMAEEWEKVAEFLDPSAEASSEEETVQE